MPTLGIADAGSSGVVAGPVLLQDAGPDVFDAGHAPLDAGSNSGVADAGVVYDAGVPRDPTPVDVVDNTLWMVVQPEDDVLSSHQPEVIECPGWAHGIESLGADTLFELETGDCNYANFSQVTLVDLRPGDVFLPYIWHLGLWAPEPATAHVALIIDGVVVWEEHLEVPSSALILQPEVVVQEYFVQGSEVVLHIHNHGVNAWRLLSIKRTIE
ncbi:MAG: hypothetical protein GY822_00185 [Deltaproteobacteria bacterium]|nr:hypothetical protein [Deltaproteobacteria bacterium]